MFNVPPPPKILHYKCLKAMIVKTGTKLLTYLLFPVFPGFSNTLVWFMNAIQTTTTKTRLSSSWQSLMTWEKFGIKQQFQFHTKGGVVRAVQKCEERKLLFKMHLIRYKKKRPNIIFCYHQEEFFWNTLILNQWNLRKEFLLTNPNLYINTSNIN